MGGIAKSIVCLLFLAAMTTSAAADTLFVRLDGSGDYIVIPAGSAPDLESFTIEAWIKPATTAPWPTIFMRGDSGTGDEFLETQLHPQNLEAACKARAFPLTLRMQQDYDHSYHFVSTFIGEHLDYHADNLFGS